MKIALIIMVISALVSSFIANTLNSNHASESRIFSAKTFGIFAYIFIMGVTAIMFWKYMDFLTAPRILLLISVCTYIKNKKKRKFCTPFWKKLRITLLAYSILGGMEFAKMIIDYTTEGNYNNNYVIIVFSFVIPIVIAFIILINIIFTHLLDRRRALSYYY